MYEQEGFIILFCFLVKQGCVCLLIYMIWCNESYDMSDPFLKEVEKPFLELYEGVCKTDTFFTFL